MHGNNADCSYPVCELITKVSFYFFFPPYKMVENCAYYDTNYYNIIIIIIIPIIFPELKLPI